MSAERPDDGGPAFPVPSPDHQTFEPENVSELRRIASGMSLRDYATIQFTAAMLANPAQNQFLHAHDERADVAAAAVDAFMNARLS